MQLDVGMPRCPSALEFHGVLSHRRPGVADAQPADPTPRIPDQVLHVGEQAARPGQHPISRRGGHDFPAGATQQAHPELPLERREPARHGGLGHPELRRRTGEAAMVDDRDEAPHVPQFHIHTHSVSL